MAKGLTPEQFADKQARNLQNAIPDIIDGVNRVTEAPGIKAALKKDKMRANILKSLDNGTWENNVKSVSLESWRDKMIKKGTNRIADGIQGARPKVVAFATQLLPYQEQLSRKIQGMADVTLEDNIRRATEQIRGMSEFKFKK